MELLQNLWQTFTSVAQEKTSYQKWSYFKIYGKLLPVQHKKKHLLPKMELLQNLWQDFTYVG